MQLVLRHVINRSHPDWTECDRLLKSANTVRNQGLYLQRQSWFYGHGVIRFGKTEQYKNIDNFMQQTDVYRLLPAFLSQQVMMSVNAEWTSFFEAIKAYNLEPDKFKGRPKPPNYKPRDGRYLVNFPNTRVYKKAKKAGIIHLSTTVIKIQSEHSHNFDCVRIIPACGCYIIEVVYEVGEPELESSEYVAGLDLGVNNLATVTSNKPGFQTILVNGRPLKSVNQGFNKFKAALTSTVKRQSGIDFSRRLENLTRRRNHIVDSYLHRATAMICDALKLENISNLVIGLNPDWKNEVKLGKRNNQSFVGIPYAKFISMLEYKLKLLGIEVIVREESYTSKASFLDLDEIPTYGRKPEGWKSSGKRIHRGLFKSSSGRIINADVNGSYNILRKEFPNAFSKGIERGASHFLFKRQQGVHSGKHNDELALEGRFPVSTEHLKF